MSAKLIASPMDFLKASSSSADISRKPSTFATVVGISYLSTSVSGFSADASRASTGLIR